MVLGKLPVPGRPTIWIIVGQGPTGLAVGVGGGCLDIFSLLYRFSFLTPSLWEMARYRLKYCLKGPLSPDQPTNQPKSRQKKIYGPKISKNLLTKDNKIRYIIYKQHSLCRVISHHCILMLLGSCKYGTSTNLTLIVLANFDDASIHDSCLIPSRGQTVQTKIRCHKCGI